MVRVLTKSELAAVQERGGTVERQPQKVELPELAEIMRQAVAQKAAMSEKYEEKWRAKLAKMDELIAAIKGIELIVNQKETDNTELMRMLRDIRKEHTKIASEHAALMAVEKEEHEGDHGPCTYKVTGRRDQRGLIDLEYGLTFTPESD